MSRSVSEPFLYLFSSKNGIFHKFLYRTFWYSRNYTYFYFPKWRYKPRMVLKITNLHILRHLPTCWLYLLERYTVDNQRCTHTASVNRMGKTNYKPNIVSPQRKDKTDVLKILEIVITPCFYDYISAFE